MVYDQEINYAWPEGSIPGMIKKFSCIGPEVDDPYVLHIPAAPCSELLPDVEYLIQFCERHAKA